MIARSRNRTADWPAVAFLGPYHVRVFERVRMNRPVAFLEFAIDFASPGVLNLGEPIAGRAVLAAVVVVFEPFDAPEATLSIGDQSAPEYYVGAGELDLAEVAMYEFPLYETRAGNLQLRAYLDARGSTQGGARIFVLFEPAT